MKNTKQTALKNAVEMAYNLTMQFSDASKESYLTRIATWNITKMNDDVTYDAVISGIVKAGINEHELYVYLLSFLKDDSTIQNDIDAFWNEFKPAEEKPIETMMKVIKFTVITKKTINAKTAEGLGISKDMLSALRRAELEFAIALNDFGRSEAFRFASAIINYGGDVPAPTEKWAQDVVDKAKNLFLLIMPSRKAAFELLFNSGASHKHRLNNNFAVCSMLFAAFGQVIARKHVLNGLEVYTPDINSKGDALTPALCKSLEMRLCQVCATGLVVSTSNDDMDKIAVEKRLRKEARELRDAHNLSVAMTELNADDKKEA